MTDLELSIPADPDWKTGLSQFLARLSERLNVDGWGARLAEKPGENTLALLGLSTLVFYAAERRANPKVNDVWDSLVYCSTCLSVGYGDIFARTPLGKIVGSALMTVGPALSSRALDGPARDSADAKQTEILATLQQILAELRARGDAALSMSAASAS
ncbi:MAG TPA: potassium channel family protein [Pirellulales bacterium]|nr:potassium channel family protein [Pirellulales bacterium]